MKTIDLFVTSITDFNNRYKSDTNGRSYSWDHCYKSFHSARSEHSPNHDYLSLQLAFYLASWGMYRGSSFLLQKDHTVHTPIVKELLKPQYDSLSGLLCSDLKDKHTQEALANLWDFMYGYYSDIRKSVHPEAKSGISDTLLTKILLGTLACTPAYDTYFSAGVKDKHVTTGTYNTKSLLRLVEFYEDNAETLENLRQKLNVESLPYPQMKLLDLGFWIIGYEKINHKQP